MRTLEVQVLYNILMFQLTKEHIYRSNALVSIENLAEKYHVRIKNVTPKNLNKIIPEFVLNPDGYSVEKLSNLFHAVKIMK